MQFGIAFANAGPFTSPTRAAEMARAAEVAGFDSLWTVEHVVVPAGYESPYPYAPSGRMPGKDDAPIPDPIVWLSYVAALTSKIKLATGILILPQRNPVVLAKELATLDHLSGGRMELGVGVGWLEEEFKAIGVPFERRGSRTDEYVEAMRTLWAEGASDFHGEFVEFPECYLEPRPVAGRIPVHIGGHTDIAARRAGRLGDGFFPAAGGHDELARLFGVVRDTAEQAGRDPQSVELTAGGNGAIGPRALDEVQSLSALGVDRVIVPAFVFAEGTIESIERYGAEVIAQAR